MIVGSPTWARTRDLRINNQAPARCGLFLFAIMQLRESQLVFARTVYTDLRLLTVRSGVAHIPSAGRCRPRRNLPGIGINAAPSPCLPAYRCVTLSLAPRQTLPDTLLAQSPKDLQILLRRLLRLSTFQRVRANPPADQGDANGDKN